MIARLGEGREESAEIRTAERLDGIEGAERSEKTLSAARLGRTILAALVALALSSVSASADEVTDEGDFDVDDSEADSGDVEPDFASTGFYIGGLGNYAVNNFNISPQSWENNWGASIRAGYRILPRLGLEAMAEWHRFESIFPTTPEFDTWVATANARLYLTEGRIQPNIVLGIGAIMTRGVGNEVSDFNDVAMRVGFGLDIYIYEGLAFIAQTDYVAALDNIKYINYFSVGIGLQYKF